MNSRPWSRRSAFLTLLLHLLVVGLAPIGDGVLHGQADDAHAPLHVESEDAGPCTTGHNHDHCLACRTFQPFDSSGSIGERLPILLGAELHASATSRSIPRALAATSSLGPRAPPQV